MFVKGRVTAVVAISLLCLLLLAGAIAASGCEKTTTAPPQEQEGAGKESGENGAEEATTVTLYFRRSVESQEWLSPERRTLSGASDPYRAAMELLIQGPEAGSQLHPVLPDSVKVIDIAVADGVCTVDFSAEILTDANQVGVSASGEGLALAAIANTLTEFEGVASVKLLVEGVQSGMVEGRFVEDFWGHVGLPEYLERSEGVIYTGPA
ncbi:MAG: GerMN domain-containing protein [Actinomycetota bacterium]|nr:GerMN domain-containing protein [Actinomycetota bacterium]MDD5668068.1 GerMN domain-containing protein [Actinomycetota bacterium]